MLVGPSLKVEDILQMFMEKGVVERGKSICGKCKLNGFMSAKRMCFNKIKRPIESDKLFDHLDPDEIYDFNPAHALKNHDESTMGHTLVSVGWGVHDGRAYLVFINSYDIV